MDLDSFLVSLCVSVDDWWQASHHSSTVRRWAAGKRRIIEGTISQLKDFFGLERQGRAVALEP